MINNRQGGRRRGRGGQSPRNVGGQPGNNRQDTRQRGNATQLLEKYKNMARDAQLGGDRVQSEYYLQYAEHYFRMLGESRSRFDEQRPQRGDENGPDDDGDGDGEMIDSAEEQREQREPRPQREQRPQREERPRRSDNRSDSRPNGSNRERDNEDDEERIAVEVLPPSIGRDDYADDEAEEPVEVKPKRRARRPRAEDSEDDIAPAA